MKRILLAEDEDILRMLIVDTLEGMDYFIDEAADGLEAIRFIEKNDYDLIVLDYMMPVYTGLEVIQQIRDHMQKKDLKVMMLSAKSQQSEQERVLQAGADYFMAKPFSPSKLLVKIKEILDEA